MKLTLVGFIFMYEKVRIFVLNKNKYKTIDKGVIDQIMAFRQI